MVQGLKFEVSWGRHHGRSRVEVFEVLKMLESLGMVTMIREAQERSGDDRFSVEFILSPKGARP